MSDRQDRQGARTPADLERRYNFGKSFSDILGIAKDAQTHAYAAEEIAKKVEAKVLDIDVVKELNVSSGTINIKTGGLVIESPDFSLSAERGVRANRGNFGGWDISETDIFKNTDSALVKIHAPQGVNDDVIYIATLENGRLTDVPFILNSQGNIYTRGIIQSSNADYSKVTTISNGHLETNSADIRSEGTQFRTQIQAGEITTTSITGRSRCLLHGSSIWFSNAEGTEYSYLDWNTQYFRGSSYKCVNIKGDWFWDIGNTTSLIMGKGTTPYARFGIRPEYNDAFAIETDYDGVNWSPMLINASNTRTNYILGYWDAQGGWSHNAKVWFNAEVISTDGTEFVSDRNAKNSIEDIPEAYGVLFDNLRPVIHKFNHGTSDRYHTAYIAQEVDEAREKAGLTRQDFAAVCIEDEGLETEKWYLRYTEFIPIHTYEIQKLKKEVAELKAKVGA